MGEALEKSLRDNVLTRNGMAHRDTPEGCGEVQVELYYEDLGHPADPPVLLIMGLGAQLPMWPDGFCAQRVESGHRVIRFDHRDTGLSAKMRAEGSARQLSTRHAAPIRCRAGHRQPAGLQQDDHRADGRGARFARPMLRPRNGRAVAAAIRTPDWSLSTAWAMTSLNRRGA